MTPSDPIHESWRIALMDRIRREAQPPEKFSHQVRLYALARDIVDSSSLSVDDDVLFAAAWVHDLGVFLGHRPADPEALRHWDSTAYTVQHAAPVLMECGFPSSKADAVLQCISTHEANGKPVTSEGIVLRDADLLEQLGAVAVMRTAAKLAQDTRFVTFADVYASLERALLTVPGHIRLPAARALAVPRTAALRAFLDALQAESKGELE